MKYSEIRQFKKVEYQENVRAHRLQGWIDEQIQDSKGDARFSELQLNPDFQRGHVWTEGQQIAFVEFILRGGKSGKDLYFNCPSWNRSVKQRDYNDFVCVDGLQRITAITKFFNNELKVFGKYKLEDFEEAPRMSSIQLTIHINDLATKKEVLEWYLEMNTGGTVHSLEEIARVTQMLEEEEN